MNHLRLSPVLAIAVLLFPWHGVAALEWENDFGVNLNVGREDNYRLTEDQEIETNSTRLSLFTNLHARSEISNLKLSLRANASEFSDSEIEDSDGYQFSLDGSREGERLRASLGLAIASESTTETELLDSGAVIDGERETASISPGLSYRLTERSSLFLNLSASDAEYDTVSLTEYTNSVISVGTRYQLTETNVFSFTLRETEYDPEDDDKTRISGLDLGYDWQSTAITVYRFSIGYSDVEGPNESESDSVYSVGVDHQIDERNSLNASIKNSYEGGSIGNVREEISLDLEWQRSLSERAQLYVSGIAINNDDRDYLSVSLGGNYRVLRNFTLGGSLRYRRQKNDFSDANASAVFFSLSYLSR